jgi:hypothetical protein
MPPKGMTMTKILRTVALEEIESSLIDLGGGNHADNMKVLRGFSRYFLVELSEVEFLSLVFLQNEHILSICPRGGDRSLRSVAQSALKTRSPNLHANWNLDDVKKRTRDYLASGTPFRPLILRDAQQSELQYGEFYIQDGSHTALGYAIALLSNTVTYSPRSAYLATNRGLS